MHLKRRNNWPPGVSALDALNDYKWQRHLAEKTLFKIDDYRPILQLSEFVWMLPSKHNWMIQLGVN